MVSHSWEHCILLLQSIKWIFFYSVIQNFRFLKVYVVLSACQSVAVALLVEMYPLSDWKEQLLVNTRS